MGLRVCAFVRTPTRAQDVQGLERRLEPAGSVSLVDEAQACWLCPVTLRCWPSAVAAPTHRPGRLGSPGEGRGDEPRLWPLPGPGPPSAHPAPRQCVSGAGSPAALHSVVEELVRFRQKVRQFALAAGEAPGEARRQLLERRPLLEACDALRRDLAAHGVSIKVSTALRCGPGCSPHDPVPPCPRPRALTRTRPVSLPRTGAACPRGSCWTRGQKTPNQGAEDTGCGGHGMRRPRLPAQFCAASSHDKSLMLKFLLWLLS